MVQNQKASFEYDGELLSDGHLSAPDDILERIRPGQKLKVRIEFCVIVSDGSSTTLKESEKNADKIVSAENSLEACYHDLLKTAEQDWSDWLSPEEDVYEEYRRYVR